MIRVIKDEWTPFVISIGRLNHDVNNQIPRTMRFIMTLFVNWAQRITVALGLRKTGFYLDNHRIFSGQVRKSGSTYSWAFGNDAHYAGYIEEGTGLLGPKHAMIKPKTAESLAWRGRDGKFIFAKETKGMRPYKVWANALNASEPYVQGIIDKAILGELRRRATKGMESTGYRVGGFE